jgi:hypothetical protein
MSRYEQYQNSIREDVTEILKLKNCQPILFIGSGLTRRYASEPNWHELLKVVGEKCPEIKPYDFYRQEFGNPIDISEYFAEIIHKWAWGAGSNNFPKELSSGSNSKQIYLKQMIVDYLESTVENFDINLLNEDQRNEIEALQSIKPHAIITTNYDSVADKIFPDYEKIIGQQVIKMNNISVGEILKIHGCVSKTESLVLTKQDYDLFTKKQKYLSAKLLTYFAEHPLIFIGYNGDDPNIKSIIGDIDEIISPNNDVISNIYILKWDSSIDKDSKPPFEQVVNIEEGRNVRIKSITASDFEWVFRSFSSDSPLEAVNPKFLRALMARTYKMIRSDIPKRTFEVDFSVLTKAATENDGIIKLFGISNLNTPADANAVYPYTTGALQDILGTSMYAILKSIKMIFQMTGTDIKTTDNKFHYAFKSGRKNTSIIHKYSELGKQLIEKAHLGHVIPSKRNN